MGSVVLTDVKIAKIVNTAQSFMLLCDHSDSSNAIHALYYLPKHFKLTVLKSDADDVWSGDAQLQGRLYYKTKEVTDAWSPYLFADAIVSKAFVQGSVPTIFSDSPEAIASAALALARR